MDRTQVRYKATPLLTWLITVLAILMWAIISTANPHDFEYLAPPFVKHFLVGVAAGYLIAALMAQGGLWRRIRLGFMLASVALGPAVMAAGFTLTARMDFDEEIGVNMAFMGPFYLALPFFMGFLCLKPLKRLPEFGHPVHPYPPASPDDPPAR